MENEEAVVVVDDYAVEGRPVNGRANKAEQELIQEDSLSIVEYFRNLAGTSAIKMKITRLEPKLWKNKAIAGHLETIDELLGEEEIKERHGGGKFKLQAFKQMPSGKYVHAGQRQVTVAGDPKLSGMGTIEDTVTPVVTYAAPSESDGLSRRALDLAEKQVEQERLHRREIEKELREVSARSPLDPDLLRMLMQPLQLQVEAAGKRADSLESALRAAYDKTPAPSMQDELVKKMLLDDGARVAALREQHASEIRQLREANQAEMARVEDRANRMIDQLERAHDRELNSLKQAHGGSVEALKMGYEARLTADATDIRRLEREANELRVEVKELREKKDVPIEDQLIRMANLREAIMAMNGDQGEEPEGAMDKLLSMGQTVVEAVSTRMAQPGATMPTVAGMMGQPQAQPQPPQPQAQTRPQQARPQQPQQTEIVIDPNELLLAVNFMELALGNDTDPGAFASTAQTAVPANIIRGIKAIGVDKFLETVVKVKSDSTLQSQKGRNFLRKVLDALKA